MEIEDVPFQVSVLRWGVHTCGGAIISPKYVLTAADCIRGPAEQYLILSGTKYKNREGALRMVDKVVVPEKYVKDKHLYDVALLRVEKPFVFDSKTQPIQLFKTNEKLSTSEGVFTGWGSHDGAWYLYDDLMAVNIKIHDDEYCQTNLKSFFRESQTCVGDRKHDIRDTDIGGPLVVDGRLYGVAVNYVRPGRFVEWGPATFTEVAAVREWIDKYAEL